MYNHLQANGIELMGDPHQIFGDASSNPSNLNLRFHDKMFVIDAEDSDRAMAITGGMNIADEYFRLGPGVGKVWRDQDAVESGPVVRDISAAFDRNFEYFLAQRRATEKPFCPPSSIEKPIISAWNRFVKDFHKHVKPMGDVFLSDQEKADRAAIQRTLQQWKSESPSFESKMQTATCRFIQSRPRFNEPTIEQVYLDLINHAEKEINIANAYFIPTPEILSALQKAAQRGVRVRVLTNSLETNDLPQMTYAARFKYLPLIKSGVEVFEWSGQVPGGKQTDGTIHAKFISVDGKACGSGSYNLDPRSRNLNSETFVAIKSDSLCKELSMQYLERDLKMAKAISLDQAKRFTKEKDYAKWFKKYLTGKDNRPLNEALQEEALKEMSSQLEPLF